MTESRELLSIIIPVYNQVDTIRQALDRLVRAPLPISREILVVDAGSTDGTRQALEAALDEGLTVDVIEADVRGGTGRAIRLGLTQARGTIIALQGAGREVEPAEVSVLVAPILRGEAVVVCGSRFLQRSASVSFGASVANRLMIGATNLLFRASLTDASTCCRVMRTEVVRSLRLSASHSGLEPQITARLLRLGYRIHEMPVPTNLDPSRGCWTAGWGGSLEALQVLVTERFRRLDAA